MLWNYRAREHLTLTSARMRMTRGETQYHKVSRFVKEIPRSLISGQVREDRPAKRSRSRTFEPQNSLSPENRTEAVLLQQSQRAEHPTTAHSASTRIRRSSLAAVQTLEHFPMQRVTESVI